MGDLFAYRAFDVLAEKDPVPITTIEAPDNATIARLSVSLGARGTINIMTLPAIPTPELGGKLKEGGHLGP